MHDDLGFSPTPASASPNLTPLLKVCWLFRLHVSLGTIWNVPMPLLCPFILGLSGVATPSVTPGL